jgi:hypothetical protein
MRYNAFCQLFDGLKLDERKLMGMEIARGQGMNHHFLAIDEDSERRVRSSMAGMLMFGGLFVAGRTWQLTL